MKSFTFFWRYVYEAARVPLTPIWGGYPVKLITHIGKVDMIHLGLFFSRKIVILRFGRNFDNLFMQLYETKNCG